jgi:hypothetical protein
MVITPAVNNLARGIGGPSLLWTILHLARADGNRKSRRLVDFFALVPHDPERFYQARNGRPICAGDLS